MNIEKENRKISKPVSINSMTEIEFDIELEKGYIDIMNRNVKSAKESFREIKEEFNL